MAPGGHVVWIRWLARLWAGVSAFVIGLIFGAELSMYGVAPLLRLPMVETLMMVAFAALWLGLALGWHHELLGGWLVVGGLTCVYLLDLAATGQLPHGPWFLLLAAPGFLYLYCAHLARRPSTMPATP